MAKEDVPEEGDSGGEGQRGPGLTSLEARVARLEVELAALRRQMAADRMVEAAALPSTAVSFAYQKDWLNLRPMAKQQELDAERKAGGEGAR